MHSFSPYSRMGFTLCNGKLPSAHSRLSCSSSRALGHPDSFLRFCCHSGPALADSSTYPGLSPFLYRRLRGSRSRTGSPLANYCCSRGDKKADQQCTWMMKNKCPNINFSWESTRNEKKWPGSKYWSLHKEMSIVSPKPDYSWARGADFHLVCYVCVTGCPDT